MNYFDLHCDTATECFQKHCSLARNSLALDLERTAGYEKWAQVFAVWIDDSLRGEEAFRYFRSVAQFFAGETAKNKGTVSFCRTAGELKKAAGSGKRAALLSIEGSAALAGNLQHLYDAKRLGVSLITLTWNGRCEVGDGCGVSDAGGLTPFGKRLVREMNRLCMVVDVSHLSEKGFWDVARTAQRPFVASHSDSKAVCGHRRNLTDEQFCEIAKGGGLVGMNLCASFLSESVASVEDVLRHADHFLNLGGENALAVGSDFDGCTPVEGLDRVERMGRLCGLLKDEFGREVADRIFWENAFDFFAKNMN